MRAGFRQRALPLSRGGRSVLEAISSPHTFDLPPLRRRIKHFPLPPFYKNIQNNPPLFLTS